MKDGSRVKNMNDFWSSLAKWFNEKTGSPLYFTYLGFYIAWNWRFFQVVFIESPSLFSGPKIEYISNFLGFSVQDLFPASWSAYIFVIDWILNLAWQVIPPAIYTVAAILFLPAVHFWALRKYLDSYFARQKLFKREEKKYNDWLLKLEEENEETLAKIASTKGRQLELEAKISRTKTQDELWDEELLRLQSNPLFTRLGELVEVLYRNGGLTHKRQTNGIPIRVISADVLAFADTSGLVSIQPGSSQLSEKLTLTDKGKFVISRFLGSK